MHLPRSSALAALEVVASTPSTNDLLVSRPDAPEFTCIVTADQTAGRGRLGRTWVAPAGASLAISLLLRPRLPAGEPLDLAHFGWIPLLAGLAMTRSVAAVVPGAAGGRAGSTVTLKWPNDVLIAGAKVSGILTELLATADGVVVGCGVNLAIGREELPTATSTSLLLAGATLAGEDLADAVLAGYLTELRSLYTGWLAVGADARAAGLADDIADACSTLGREVRVELPGGTALVGTATGIDASGRLVVRRSSDGTEHAVAAGDVTHLRYE